MGQLWSQAINVGINIRGLSWGGLWIILRPEGRCLYILYNRSLVFFFDRCEKCFLFMFFKMFYELSCSLC
jgi:hypothetical protein